MAKWIVTKTETWEGIEEETGTAAIDFAQQSGPGETEWSTETEDGEQPCEGCGKPATHSDIEGVPLCKKCWDDMLNEPDTFEAYEEGDRVYGIGKGDRKWDPQPVGDIVRVSEGQGSIFVQWDNSSVEDEMNPWEVRPAE